MDAMDGGLRARRIRGIQWAMFTAVAVVALRFIPLTSHLFIFPLVENFAYDAYFDYRPEHDMSRYVIVAIDEKSLQPNQLGRYPWPRSVYARLLPRLAQARVVAFDVLMPEPEANDALLAAAMRRHGRVVLAAHQRRRQSGRAAPAVSWQGYGAIPAQGLSRASADTEFIGPTPVLAAAAAGIGYADLAPDSDAIFRRVKPLQVGANDRVYPHFATEIVRVATGADPAAITASAAAGALRPSPGRPRTVPLCRGNMLINYGGPQGTVPTLSFCDVLAGHYPLAAFRDKIVLIGATAAGLSDVRPAPFRAANHVFYGVETDANIVHTLLEGPPLRDVTGSLLWGLYALLVGMFVGWAIWTSRETIAAIIGLGALLVLALPIFFIAIIWLHQVVPYGAVLWGIALPAALALSERLGVEKRQVREQFSTYVSSDVLRELTEHPALVRTGQRRQVTLLFADVRGSTALAENMAPDLWLAQLNEYLSEMSEAVFAYQGYLDKFMGDGLMAFWNAFGTQPDHAELALKAGLQMLERLKVLNARWASQPDRTPFRIGVGLHTGEAIVGDVGSHRRAQYTAIGDVVNAASRLETATKEFHAEILLSETTAALVRDRISLLELGEASLRGRAQPLRIFKPEGYEGEKVQHVRQATEEEGATG